MRHKRYTENVHLQSKSWTLLVQPTHIKRLNFYFEGQRALFTVCVALLTFSAFADKSASSMQIPTDCSKLKEPKQSQRAFQCSVLYLFVNNFTLLTTSYHMQNTCFSAVNGGFQAGRSVGLRKCNVSNFTATASNLQ